MDVISNKKAGCLKFNIFKGIPVYVHWTFPAAGLLIYIFVDFAMPETIYYCIGYCMLIIFHELAHAFAASCFRLEVMSIEVSGAGGLCCTGYPPTFAQAMLFSSAGILAQTLLIFVTIAYLQIIGEPSSVVGICVVMTFTFANGALIIFNLIPCKRRSENFGTDGYLLWKLIANRMRGRPYTFPDTSATFATHTRLTRLQGFMPPGFTTGIEILNDNDTSMEFVVSTLTTHLHISKEEAVHMMLDIHKKGGLLIPLPSSETAAKTAEEITSDAKANGFNLICRPVDAQEDT